MEAPLPRMALPLTQVEQRMAFHAKILKDGQLTLNEEGAAEWRRDLPAAIRGQHLLLDRAGPRGAAGGHDARQRATTQNAGVKK